MLAAENMLNALASEDREENHQDHNDDHDFGAVLEFCGNGVGQQHKFRYSDGREEFFSFDE
ncbi:MAG: hypothetical protein NC420_12545 [Eubacterium sp.]|nr:hypothetical protein [Eubacterium sp.]MCM1217753.1 hypothetical protein [Lachnospiraceae bacterium]MCM1303394.1 hypothetical protein [Butyrivibrio sp.]MCM1342553.1 hypothetical protein [Muribaculaceae bacterium]MCM1238197.1 hypothetical protein [Lachnospiraceae bacterium]